jgi:predicted kinase
MRLIDLLNEGVYDPGILKCVFLAGGPGSGKSKVAKDIFGIANGLSVSSTGLKSVNSDTAFEHELKKNGIDPKDLARIKSEDPALWDKITKDPKGVRELAKQTTQKIKSFYEAGRLGMIIDGTGDDVAKIQKQKQRAESLGYDCYMVFVNTSLEVAQERNKMRDRSLPTDLVNDIWKDCQQNMGKFQSIFGGNFRIVDNSKNGNNVTSDVRKAVDGFIRSDVRNPLGKEWIATQKALKNANIIK